MEVSHLKYIKFSKTWGVKVEDDVTEAEAKKLIAANPDKYLDSETVTRTEYKGRQQKTGWVHAAKEQLVGSNGKR